MLVGDKLVHPDFIYKKLRQYNVSSLPCGGVLIMKQFLALGFYSLAYWLGTAETMCNDEPQDTLISSKHAVKDLLGNIVGKVAEGCELLELRVSKRQTDRVQEDLMNSACTFGTISQGLTNLHERVFDELGTTVFFHLPMDRAQYFLEPWKTFGQRVVEIFPAITRDVEEAGKCYASKRNTACVFHLMRIMEHGLKVLAKQIGIETQVPSWDGILGKIDRNLAAKFQDKDLMWVARERYFAEAASYLRAVKTAWRNPVMHIADHYSDDEAQSIYQTVQVFMKHLADNIASGTSDSSQ